MKTEKEVKEELKQAQATRDEKVQAYRNYQSQIQAFQQNANQLALEINALNERIETLEWIRGKDNGSTI